MNWKLNKTIRIKKRKENKRKEIITIIMDWAQFLSWAWSKWNGGFFFEYLFGILSEIVMCEIILLDYWGMLRLLNY